MSLPGISLLFIDKRLYVLGFLCVLLVRILLGHEVSMTQGRKVRRVRNV